MKDFFTIKKVAENIFCIQETFFKEKANLFLIKDGNCNLLIDCGIGVANLKSFLHKHGVKDLKLVITHAHFDHAGGIGQFSPTEIIATNKVLKNLHNRSLWGLELLEPNQFDSAYLKNLNLTPEGICHEFVMTMPDITPYSSDKIYLKNQVFEIIHLPGHTDDSVVLYDRTNKLLFSGDVLYDGEIYCDLPNSNRHDFLASLLFLKNLEVNTLFPGHNDPSKINEVDYRRCLGNWIGKLKDNFR